MEQLKMNIKLGNVLSEYLKVLKNNILYGLLILIVSDFLYFLLSKIDTQSYILQVLVSFCLQIVTFFSLFFIIGKYYAFNKEIKGKVIIKVVLYIVAYSVVYIAIENLIIVFPKARLLFLFIIPCIFDILFVIVLDKIIAKSNNIDSSFLVKYGFFYFFIRIILVYAIAIIIKNMLGLNDASVFFPTIANTVKIALLPIIPAYFIEKKQKENELGISI